MDEYISREKALREIMGEYPDAHYPDWYASIIKEIPAADVVEVVRCKDCKRSGMYAFGFEETERLACLDIEEDGAVSFAIAVDADGYCSNAERKEK